MLVVWIPYTYEWQEYYVCEFAQPRIAERYGFEFGTVSFSRENVTYAWPGIVSQNIRTFPGSKEMSGR
jgi:hypothetical protein